MAMYEMLTPLLERYVHRHKWNILDRDADAHSITVLYGCPCGDTKQVTFEQE